MRRPLHLLLALLLLVFSASFALGCGDDEDPPPNDPPPMENPPDETEAPAEPTQQDLADAGVDPITGAYQGLELDTRSGTEPAGAAAGALPAAAQKAGCTLRLNLRDEGDEHLEEGDALPEYGTKPATSGPHDAVPVADGAYREAPPEQNAVHSLEHGRVSIQYAPSLPEDQQLALKGAFFADPDGMLLSPNEEMPYDVAVVAWRNLMGCEQVTDLEALTAAVLAFRDKFRGRGPERVPL